MKKHLQIALPFIVLSALTISCNPSKNQESYRLTVRERSICDSMKLDSTIIQDLRAYNNNNFEPFHYSLSKLYQNGVATELDPVFLAGLVFNEQNMKSSDLILNLKDQFRKKGYTIFLLENNFNINNLPDRIGVLKTSDQYSVLKQIKTDGTNYDISNDSLIKIIKQLDEKYTLELIGASGDYCEFLIHKDPQSWNEFAKEIYKVCPDVVDQGSGTVEALAEEMKNAKRLYLWWD